MFFISSWISPHEFNTWTLGIPFTVMNCLLSLLFHLLFNLLWLFLTLVLFLLALENTVYLPNLICLFFFFWLCLLYHQVWDNHCVENSVNTKLYFTVEDTNTDFVWNRCIQNWLVRIHNINRKLLYVYGAM